jgi:nucleoside-diphosphate-sugar epimerase
MFKFLFMHTILGSTGIIGFHTAKALSSFSKKVRLVSRNPIQINSNDELVKANLLDFSEVKEAVKGSEVVYLVVGLTYSVDIWKREWPIVMTNVIEACKLHGAKLVFFDNVYSYGKINGIMTEDTPFNPCSRKGEIRAEVVTQLLEEMKWGNIEAAIARSADFYGPKTPNTFLGPMVFEKFAKKQKAQWLVNENYKHSFTYTPDAGLGCAMIGTTPTAFGQTWHLPTHKEVLTGKEFMELTAMAFAAPPRFQVLPKWSIKMVGWFNPIVAESYEMLYQLEEDYIFSSTKFEEAFQFEPTSYKRGVVDTVASYL